jgi:3-oxoacyl-[acyl-carrier protein] reductase
MDLGLANKIVLVTGASRGLGYATAEQFLLEKAVTIINSRDKPHLLEAQKMLTEKTHTEPIIFEGDMTHKSFPANITEFIEDNFHRLDILVTNTGGPPPGSFESLSDANWTDAIELSFLSHARLIRACLPLLRKSDSPSVLTVTSYSAKQPIPNLVLSNAIRSATIGLTKTLALEFAHEKIRFNSILPGWTETDRVTHLFENRAAVKGTTPAIEKQIQEDEIPLKRLARPDEFGKIAAFLSSPAASYMTGLMISVDGGIVKGTY